MKLKILAYFADLLFQEDPNGETLIDRRWITPEERNDLIGDGRVIAATFVPLFEQQDVGPSARLATAWLIKSSWSRDFVTARHENMRAALHAGAKATPLAFGNISADWRAEVIGDC